MAYLFADDELVIVADPLFALGGVRSHLLRIWPVYAPFLDGHVFTDLTKRAVS